MLLLVLSLYTLDVCDSLCGETLSAIARATPLKCLTLHEDGFILVDRNRRKATDTPATSIPEYRRYKLADHKKKTTYRGIRRLEQTHAVPGELPLCCGIHSMIISANVPLMKVGFLSVIHSSATEYDAKVCRALTDFHACRKRLK